MLKCVVLAAVAVCVSAQLLGNLVIDTIHGFRVEYDDSHDIILMVGQSDCYIVQASDSAWDSLVKDQTALHRVSEEIFKRIDAGTGVSSLTHSQAVDKYHSRLERWQCMRKSVHEVVYTPAASGN